MTDITLADYYDQAGVSGYPDWAKSVLLDPEKPPFKSQITDLTRVLSNIRWGLLSETGAGKSKPALAASLFYAGTGNKVIYLTKTTLTRQVYEEVLTEYRGVESYVKLGVLKDTASAREKQVAEWTLSGFPDILISGYQRVLTVGCQGEPMWKVLRRVGGYTVIFIDEFQGFARETSALYKNLEALVGSPEEQKMAVYPMTGTPTHNGPFSAFTLLRLLYGELLYSDRFRFELRYGTYQSIPLKTPKVLPNGRKQTKFRVLTGYQRLEDMNRHLYGKASRHLKSDIPELAMRNKPVITQVPVVLAKSHLDLFKKFVADKYLELGDDKIVLGLQEQRLRSQSLQLLANPAPYTPTGQHVPNYMLEALHDQMEMRTAGSKVIVFCNYRATVEALEAALAEWKFNPAVIYGGMSDADREGNRKKFLTDPECRCIVMNLAAGGAGFNFQSVSNEVIFYEHSGVPGDFKQGMDRVDRPGQRYAVNITLMVPLGVPMVQKTIHNMLDKDSAGLAVTKDPKSLWDLYRVDYSAITR